MGPEDGSNTIFRNVGMYLQVYTVLQPRKPTLTLSPQPELLVSYDKDRVENEEGNEKHNGQ
jgi:hypothetical protein